MKYSFWIILILTVILAGCRDTELVVPTEYEVLPIEPNADADPMGMYLVNEGNMGSNKASIDYVDYRTGFYARDIYAEINPNVVKELGDVANDIQIYKDRLFVVVNCSNKVEVMDAKSAKRITQIEIPNCRYIRFHGNYAYVSSYAAPVSVDPNAPQGAVFKIDLDTYAIVDKVIVGYQPDELEILGDYIYVANSGGYRAPRFDNTVSIIEIESFRQIRKIPVGINLSRVKVDKYGKVWVSSRGNYDDIDSNLYVLDRKHPNTSEYVVTDTLNIPCSNMAISGDSLLLYSVEYNYNSKKNKVSYAVIDVRTKQVISKDFITDGSVKNITIPYGIAIHPYTKDIYVTDARNYVSSGMLHCYTSDGKRKWSVRTGDIPAHMAFLMKEDN